MAAPYTPPAGFAHLTEDAWRRYVGNVQRDAARLYAALAAGDRPPIRPGELARLRSLIAGIRAAHAAVTVDEAMVAAWQTSRLAPALARALEGTLAAVPPAADEALTGMETWLAQAGGQTARLAPTAVALLVDRTQQAITHDWEDLAVGVRDRIVTTLHSAVTGGLGVEDAVRAMTAGFAEVSGWTRARAENVARTEIADVMHGVARESMTEAGAVAWAWDATEDSRTCEICLTQHGRVFPMTEPMDSHQMCRCAQVPIFADETGRLEGEPLGGDLGYWPDLGPVDQGTLLGLYPKAVQANPPADLRLALARTPNPGWRPSWKVA